MAEDTGFWIGGFLLFAVVGSCVDQMKARSSTPTQPNVSYVQQPVSPAPGPSPTWDEKSDCAPGAAPNSLANALDIMKVHCDRPKAYAKAAMILGALAVPVLAEGALAGESIAARGAAGVVSRTTLSEAGAAVDSVAASEVATADVAATAVRTYRVAPTEAGSVVARPYAAPRSIRDPYEARPRGDGGYYVRSPTSGRTFPVEVRGVAPDTYEVTASDGSRSVVNGTTLRRWYDPGYTEDQVWADQSSATRAGARLPRF